MQTANRALQNPAAEIENSAETARQGLENPVAVAANLAQNFVQQWAHKRTTGPRGHLQENRFSLLTSMKEHLQTQKVIIPNGCGDAIYSGGLRCEGLRGELHD
jgi:hypothetical protein